MNASRFLFAPLRLCSFHRHRGFPFSKQPRVSARTLLYTPLKNNNNLLSHSKIHSRSYSTQTNPTAEQSERNNKKVGLWLLLCCSVVGGIVVVGGITRLTQSGLSITEWKPLIGALPPSNDEKWIEEFERYKQFPEYKRLNPDMTLDQFKRIYFWEYSHRLLGRAIGVVFLFPFLYYLKRGYINKNLSLKMAGVFLLGGSQGLLGWYMVKSGLDEKNIDEREGVPRVSQYRLAAHLGSAFVIYCSLWWLALDLLTNKKPINLNGNEFANTLKTVKILRFGTPFITGLVFITALSGAFVAGLDAGLIYNTFPYMGGKIIPNDLINPKIKPTIKNIFENEVTVQFEHRVLAMTTFSSILTLYFLARGRGGWKGLPKSVKVLSTSLVGVACVQVSLGIATLLTFVPTPLASAHQMGSLTLLTVALWFLHFIRRIPK